MCSYVQNVKTIRYLEESMMLNGLNRKELALKQQPFYMRAYLFFFNQSFQRAHAVFFFFHDSLLNYEDKYKCAWLTEVPG